MKKVLTVGRSSHCDIILQNECISREHARISIVNGQYVYEDIGKNGSVIGGKFYKGERIVLVPGTEVLLSGRVPLPWSHIYAMLPLKGVFVDSERTEVLVSPASTTTYQQPREEIYYNPEDRLAVGWGILAFIIPLIGWIMYFIWKEETPKRASKVAGLAWAGFFFNFFLSILSL